MENWLEIIANFVTAAGGVAMIWKQARAAYDAKYKNALLALGILLVIAPLCYMGIRYMNSKLQTIDLNHKIEKIELTNRHLIQMDSINRKMNNLTDSVVTVIRIHEQKLDEEKNRHHKEVDSLRRVWTNQASLRDEYIQGADFRHQQAITEIEDKYKNDIESLEQSREKQAAQITTLLESNKSLSAANTKHTKLIDSLSTVIQQRVFTDEGMKYFLQGLDDERKGDNTRNDKESVQHFKRSLENFEKAQKNGMKENSIVLQQIVIVKRKKDEADKDKAPGRTLD